MAYSSRHSSQCQRLSTNEGLIVGDHGNRWVAAAEADGLYHTTEERPCKMSQNGWREEVRVALLGRPGSLALGELSLMAR